MKKLAPLFALAVLGLSFALTGCSKPADDAAATDAAKPAAGADAKTATPPAVGDTK